MNGITAGETSPDATKEAQHVSSAISYIKKGYAN